MKNLIATLFALALPCLLLAQSDISESYNMGNASSLKINFQYGDITIEKHTGKEILMEGSVKVNAEDGIKYFDIKTSKNNNQLTLLAEADFEKVGKQLTIVMNDGTKIFKKGKNISIMDVDGMEGVDKAYTGVDVDAKFRIKVPANIQLEVETTYGSVTVNDYWENMKLHSTYGSVDLVLNNPPSSPQLDVSSTYSDVDVTIPESVNADLRMTTGYGQIFTDLDFKPDYKKKGEGCEFGQDISATLNNGKGKIRLDATYSNIYLRKPL